jgi:RNA polymerase sigma-70 factor (ECF subfamily)
MFRAYSPYVAAIAWRLLARDDEIEDVVQEVFLRAVSGLREMRAPEAIKGWLGVVTVRVARRRLRARKVRAFFGFGSAIDHENLPSKGADAHDLAVLSEVHAALAAVPVNKRIAWLLRYGAGESLEQIATSCGCSLATTKRWIAEAQKHLEETLS